MGVRIALEDAGGFTIVAEAASAAEAVSVVEELRPDLCLLDVHMPGGGIVAAAKISKSVPGTQVVMLTASRNDDDLFESLRAGAAGYLLKDTDPMRLRNALRGAMQGEAAIPRNLVSRLVAEFRDAGKGETPLEKKGIHLTPRETEVLNLMREGKSTDEIAQEIFVSQVTVRTHVASILKKLDVRDRLAAVRMTEEL